MRRCGKSGYKKPSEEMMAIWIRLVVQVGRSGQILDIS